MTNQTRKIKKIEDLPAWFDLEKYAAARQLDAGAWARHLMVRSSIRRNIKENQFLNESEKEATLGILQDPIRLGVTEGSWPEEGNVWPMTVDDSFSLTRALIGHSSELSNIWKVYSKYPISTRNNDFDINWTDSEWRVIDSEVARYGLGDIDPPWCYTYPHLTVNLSATDEQLVEDFKIWLADWRKSMKEDIRPNLFTREQFNNWVDEGRLPCLDLMIWEELNGVEITHQLMADTLELFSADKIRRTTRKNANELVEKKTINALLSQANSKGGKTT